MDANHIEQERRELMLTGMPSARRRAKASKEMIGKKCTFRQRNEQGCWGKEATGGPISESFVGHESSQRQEGRFLRPGSQRQHFEKKENAFGVVGRTSQVSKCCAGKSLKMRGKSALRLKLARGFCGSKVAMTGDSVVSGLVLPLWEEVLWPFLDAWDSVRPRTTSTQWNVPRRYGPHGELFFFFLLKKEPMVLRELVRCGPSIPVETVKSICLDRSAHDD